jgi:pimeloyl-ACP methyl ester carboxylesterase
MFIRTDYEKNRRLAKIPFMKTFLPLLLFVITQPSLAQTAQSNDPTPPGKFIDIGGYRLHIDAEGKGSPAVIFIAGATAFSFDWALVAPEIAKVTQAVTYDRPALAWSDPGPMPRSLEQDVYELHELLQKATIKPPYILVGHSLGGIIARKFEKKYADEVKGLVLVDATSENTTLFINNKIQKLRLLSENKEIPLIKTRVDTFTKVPSQKDMDDFLKMVGEPTINSPFDKLPQKFQRARLWAMKQPKILIADNGSYWAEEFAAMYTDSTYSLGNKPLFVLTSGRNDYPKELGDSTRSELINQKLNDQEKIAAISLNSKHVVTIKSGHEIHLSAPELVINATKEVIQSVKTGERLR